MRILLINDYADESGGAEVILRNLRGELLRRGHDVRLFASHAHDGNASTTCLGTTSRLRTLLQCANPDAAAVLHRELRRFRPDAVHVSLYLTQLSPFILPVLQDWPVVYYAQWLRAICPLGTRFLPDGSPCREHQGVICLRNGCVPLRDWIPLQLQRFLDARWCGAFSRVTAISRFTADRLAEYGGRRFDSVQVIYPGAIPPTERGDPPAEPMILFAGRLTREKGAEVLIRAFAVAAHQYPEARLEIAGDGPERGNLSALAARLGIASSVRFPGKLSNREVTRRMREAWAVCIPSVWEEPFGFVAAEAQLHGIAVIASDMGGLREILDEGRAGVSVAPGSVEELTGAITRIFSSRHLAGEIGHSGRLRALREFSSERFGDEFEKVFFELARPRKT